MLWYKAFRETRVVSVVGLVSMVLACLFIVYYQQTMRDHADTPLTYVGYVYKGVYNSLGRDIFAILAIIMGSGGLLQEKSAGTIGFTLGLPKSRSEVVFWRAIVGYLSVLAFALIPVIVVPLASIYMGQSYPLDQALKFSILWASCGGLFYSYTFYLSHRLEGEYTSVLLAIPTLLLYGAITQLPWLTRIPWLNIFSVMNGEDMSFFDEQSRMIVGSLPWVALAMFLVVAASFVYAAARRVEPRDF